MIDKNQFDAIIFDLDGVLLDTEGAMLKSTIAGFADYGVTVCAEDFIPFFGTGSDTYFGGVCAKYGIPFTPELRKHMYDRYLTIVDKEAVLFPGIPEKVHELYQAGFRIAVASSSSREKVAANLRVAGISTDWLECIVTEDDVTKAKPDPMIFLKAAKGLKVSPEKCLVCEDSFSGVTAAVAAGMKCVGIRGSYSDDKLTEAGAFTIMDSIVYL